MRRSQSWALNSRQSLDFVDFLAYLEAVLNRWWQNDRLCRYRYDFLIYETEILATEVP